ncbi:hypothetical protein LAUMK191_05659 [Mycobacterium attenuatum]|nr:hypothetical protein LAUMK191_05659 [Mycobacterium attenuatum]
MRSSAAVSRVKVSAGGRGVVSHAGMGLLRESADLAGLSAQLTAVLADTYKGPWLHAPGAVLPDLAAAVADGADCIDGVGRLRGDRTHVFGADGLDDHRPLRPRLPRSRGRGPSTSPRAGTRPSIPPGESVRGRDHHVPLPGAARRGPHHPRCPPTTATHRRHLAVGHHHRDRLAPPTQRLPLTHKTPSRRPERPKPAPGKPAQPGDTGQPNTPHTLTSWRSTPFAT